MGQDKPGLPFPGPTDEPLVYRVAAAVASVAGPPTIAGPQDYGTGWRRVGDEPGLSGPVAGLIAGLAANPLPLLLVLAADLPFPSPNLARGLADLARSHPRAQVIIPERDGRLEPLFAIYRNDCRADLLSSARQLTRRERGPSLRGTLERLQLRRVAESEWRVWDPDGDSFVNCNTPDELAAAAARVHTGREQGGIR
jgi:molybdopterin-guanine dinucleotide biosynthesis protein A